MENVTVKKAKTEGQTKAYVTVKEGRLTATFTVVEADEKFYLNNPSHFDKNLKGNDLGGGRKSTGHIDHAYISDKAWKAEILDFALNQIGIEVGVAA